MEKKLNLGSGTKILSGFINLDIAPVNGVDVVHDLNQYPWPFVDNEFDYVLVEDVIEHLDSPIRAIEEIYRVTKSTGLVDLQVPYWNSWSANTDLTHKNYFTENSFDYFIPSTKLGHLRSYYSHARFELIEKCFVVTPLTPWLPIPKLSYFEIKNPFIFNLTRLLASFLSNIIQDFKLKLKPIKEIKK